MFAVGDVERGERQAWIDEEGRAPTPPRCPVLLLDGSVCLRNPIDGEHRDPDPRRPRSSHSSRSAEHPFRYDGQLQRVRDEGTWPTGLLRLPISDAISAARRGSNPTNVLVTPLQLRVGWPSCRSRLV
ncbi:MAG: hypothetical protein JWO98_165 [Frankiales bacterium]|nr:hypothetical protein [Frankiales bacterium]